MMISETPYVFQTLMQLGDPSKFLFSSDYPFIHEIVVKEMIRWISKFKGLNEQERIVLEYKNALSLFPRLKYN